MCGIVAAVSDRDVAGMLLESLKDLEYRGYDSAGIAVFGDERIRGVKKVGRVGDLMEHVQHQELPGYCGIAHTRWATHGKLSDDNAHPHFSGGIALVHNGIIENYRDLRDELEDTGYTFKSDTDSEAIVHLIHRNAKQGGGLRAAVQATTTKLKGTYAFAVISKDEPDLIIGATLNMPLLLGIGKKTHFLVSDAVALRDYADQFARLQNGDIVEISKDAYKITNNDEISPKRPVKYLEDLSGKVSLGDNAHYMHKEIKEQPDIIAELIAKNIRGRNVRDYLLGAAGEKKLLQVKNLQIVACGTSYHAGLVAKHWFEDLVQIPCSVEIASEYRYREVAVPKDTLFISISQSGETADTLAALHKALKMDYLSYLAICNAPHSAIVRDSHLLLLTDAGPEISVASTKAFTTQLTVLLLFALSLSRKKFDWDTSPIKALLQLPELMRRTLRKENELKKLAEEVQACPHILFLGRGMHFPIALEGALKMKEISYIHAEGYPAGELKHGPLALVDESMPVVGLVPGNRSINQKILSNLEEVHSRGGKLILFTDQPDNIPDHLNARLITLPFSQAAVSPILYTLPLQLFAYHTALLKGTNIDQPRNLAKSVTVE